MRFREILLVIFLLAVGVVIYQAQTGRWDLRFGWDDGTFGWGGKEYAFEETQVIEAPLPSGLEITNSHGWVEVRGTDQETVQLTFKKRIWRRDEADAQEVAGKLKCVVNKTADRLSLSTNREEFTKRNFETGFVLVVPRRMAVTVDNSYGLVRVESVKEATVHNRHGRASAADIDGACVLDSTYDDIEALNVKADCRVLGRHADVRIAGVAGGLRVDNTYGEIRFEDIEGKTDVVGNHCPVDGRRAKGPVSVETSYEGISLSDVGPARVRAHHCPVEAAEVHGDLDVQTTYEPVKARSVQGNFLVTGNNVEVTASGITGQEISITSSHENVDLSDFAAKVTISLRHGNIVLSPSSLKFPVDVRSEYGNIDFYWPAGEASPLEAQSRGGSVKWGLSGKPSLEKSNGTSLVKAFVENTGKPAVFLSTSYGDIRIEEKHGTF
jgi:DUF4097 and DUF4098 domain-containing protein YvlB